MILDITENNWWGGGAGTRGSGSRYVIDRRTAEKGNVNSVFEISDEEKQRFTGAFVEGI